MKQTLLACSPRSRLLRVPYVSTYGSSSSACFVSRLARYVRLTCMHVALLFAVLFYVEAIAVLDSSLVACGGTHVLVMQEIG